MTIRQCRIAVFISSFVATIDMLRGEYIYGFVGIILSLTLILIIHGK